MARRVLDAKERLDMTIFDSLDAEDLDPVPCAVLFGERNLGNPEKSNLISQGTLAASNVFLIEEIHIGAPTKLLPTWQDVQVVLSVGNKPWAFVPVWLRPDAVIDPAHLEPGVAVDSGVTPVGWTFLSFRRKAPVMIATRQRFNVYVHKMGGQPQGTLRVALKGMSVRDIE